MTREDVRNVVKKYVLQAIEDVTEDDIERAQTMADLGATSLDIIEVVSCSMRELKVKVPREELMKIHSLDVLVDRLHLAFEEKEHPEPTA